MLVWATKPRVGLRSDPRVWVPGVGVSMQGLGCKLLGLSALVGHRDWKLEN